MNHDSNNIPLDRQSQLETIRRAASDAVREALRRHMLLGESVAVADPRDNGEVRILGPDEIRQALEQQ